MAFTPPSGWAYGFLENYDVYHIRYLAIDCNKQHDTLFFTQCCSPLLATESLAANRLPECDPAVRSSSSSQLAASTSFSSTSRSASTSVSSSSSSSSSFPSFSSDVPFISTPSLSSTSTYASTSSIPTTFKATNSLANRRLLFILLPVLVGSFLLALLLCLLCRRRRKRGARVDPGAYTHLSPTKGRAYMQVWDSSTSQNRVVHSTENPYTDVRRPISGLFPSYELKKAQYYSPLAFDFAYPSSSPPLPLQTSPIHANVSLPAQDHVPDQLVGLDPSDGTQRSKTSLYSTILRRDSRLEEGLFYSSPEAEEPDEEVRRQTKDEGEVIEVDEAEQSREDVFSTPVGEEGQFLGAPSLPLEQPRRPSADEGDISEESSLLLEGVEVRRARLSQSQAGAMKHASVLVQAGNLSPATAVESLTGSDDLSPFFPSTAAFLPAPPPQTSVSLPTNTGRSPSNIIFNFPSPPNLRTANSILLRRPSSALISPTSIVPSPSSLPSYSPGIQRPTSMMGMFGNFEEAMERRWSPEGRRASRREGEGAEESGWLGGGRGVEAGSVSPTATAIITFGGGHRRQTSSLPTTPLLSHAVGASSGSWGRFEDAMEEEGGEDVGARRR